MSDTRESRSVRLRLDEWVLAEAIARLGAGRPSAGQGIRDSLHRERDRLRRAGQGMALDAYMEQILRERAEGDR